MQMEQIVVMVFDVCPAHDSEVACGAGLLQARDKLASLGEDEQRPWGWILRKPDELGIKKPEEVPSFRLKESSVILDFIRFILFKKERIFLKMKDRK
jgi:hypothetical protein